MNRRSMIFAIGLLAIFSLVLAACASTQPDAPPVEPPPADTPEPDMPPETEEPMMDEATIFLMGADGLLSDTHFENIGASGVGVYYSGPAIPSGDDYTEFVGKYEAAYGERPIQAFHAHAYDATTMVLKAIDEVAEEQADGSLSIDRLALIQAMYAMSHDGLTGSLSCNEFGDCAAPNIGIYRFTDASQTAADVLGASVATSSFDPPSAGMGVVPDAPEGSDFGAVVVAAGAPIELATLQAISGAVASLGTDQVRAVEIAIADYGDIKGHTVQLSQEEDDLCNSEGGQLGAQRIVANPAIVAVIGTSCSGAAVPASEVLSAAGVMLVSASNTSPRLTATGYLAAEGPSRGDAWSFGYFRTAHNDEFQGRGAAAFAFDNLGLTTAATINDGDPYTQGLTTAFGASFEEFGGTIVLATAVGKEQEDMRPVLTEVAASGAELLYFPIFEPAGNFIILQAEEVGLQVIR